MNCFNCSSTILFSFIVYERYNPVETCQWRVSTYTISQQIYIPSRVLPDLIRHPILSDNILYIAILLIHLHLFDNSLILIIRQQFSMNGQIINNLLVYFESYFWKFILHEVLNRIFFNYNIRPFPIVEIILTNSA